MSLFLPVIDAFNREQIVYVVIGGLAVVLHGHDRPVPRLELVVGLDKANASKAVEIVLKLGYAPRLKVDPMGFADFQQRKAWMTDKDLEIFSFYKKDEPQFGIDFFMDYPVDFDGLLARAIEKNVESVPVRIGGIEDLITLKKMSGREDDVEDIRMLEIILERATSN